MTQSCVWFFMIGFSLLEVMEIQVESAVCPPRPSANRVRFQHSASRKFYVDIQNGNNNWNGALEAPNAAATNGPFKTLLGAIVRIRQQRTSTSEQATLFVRQGIYEIANRIILDQRDSSLSIVGYPTDTRPIISGANRIPAEHFFQFDQKIFAGNYSGPCSKHAFLGNKRLVRARKPNLVEWKGNEMSGQGPYLTIKDLLEPTSDCDRQGSGGFRQNNCNDANKDGFIFREGDLDPQWSNSSTGDILVFQAWVAERGQIAVIGNDSRVNFTAPLRFPIGRHPIPSGWRYIVENIFEELDTAGEFFCDETAGRFYIIPPDGTLGGEDVYIGKADRVFRVQGAKNIRFSDLDFRHSHDNNFGGYNTRPGLLDFDTVDGLTIDRCSFSNVAYTAIFLISSINVKIFRNSFNDVGNIAISTEYRNDPNDTFANRNIVIKWNTIEGCGVINMFQPCCILVKGVGNIEVTDNEISRSSYAGIRIGWQTTFTLDYVPEGDYIFYIERNHVHDFGLGILSDFAGIYLSSNPACGARHADVSICFLHAYIAKNAVYNALAFSYGALGVYGDTAVSALTVEKNWLYDLADTAINFHCGQHNFALNNMIFHTSGVRVFGTCNDIVGDGVRPRQILTFKRNVVYVNNVDALMFRRVDYWDFDVPTVNNNIYYFSPFVQSQLENFFPEFLSFEEWRNTTGNDNNSQIINPAYWNIQEDDYRLKCYSPAFRLGIETVDLRSVRTNSGIC